MKEFLYQHFSSQTGALTMRVIAMNILLSLVIGFVIYISYRFSRPGVVYSPKFNVSLVMLTVITAIIMTVIGNNIALSLGMVGALSIVRFRTAIKDPRDTAYIFWCIAVGICCGTSQYFIAGTGTAVLFMLLLVFGRIQSNDRYLLIIRGDRRAEIPAETMVSAYYSGKARLRVKNTSRDDVEFIYELSQRMLNKIRSKDKSITEKLYEVDGISQVNLVCQNDEISG